MRIWFNHWFSTVYHLIGLMREGYGEPITVIGSNSNASAVYKSACDEWYTEKELPDAEYAEFCLEFCREHQIDVFAPRRGLTAVSAASARFAEAGVKLMTERDGALTALLDDKEASYRFFGERLPGIVPPYRIARSFEDFRAALEELGGGPGRLCYKLIEDEGARSFRVIDDGIEGIGSLYAKPGSKVTRAAAEKVLSGYDFSIPMLVMPYLSGADVSADCLITDKGNIILPRFKVGRFHEVRRDEGVIALCEEILKLLKPEMPVNIQFKLEGDIPWLLEINPRMSGGLQLSCLATGINLPAAALCKLAGKPFEWHFPESFTDAGLVNLETPVLVRGGAGV